MIWWEWWNSAAKAHWRGVIPDWLTIDWCFEMSQSESSMAQMRLRRWGIDVGMIFAVLSVSLTIVKNEYMYTLIDRTYTDNLAYTHTCTHTRNTIQDSRMSRASVSNSGRSGNLKVTCSNLDLTFWTLVHMCQPDGMAKWVEVSLLFWEFRESEPHGFKLWLS